MSKQGLGDISARKKKKEKNNYCVKIMLLLWIYMSKQGLGDIYARKKKKGKNKSTIIRPSSRQPENTAY